MPHSEKPHHRHLFLVGLLSTIWFILRTGTKPSRAHYPCQRVARLNSEIWLSSLFLPLLSIRTEKLRKHRTTLAIAAILIVGSLGYYTYTKFSIQPIDTSNTTLVLNENQASITPASDIYIVQGSSESQSEVEDLIQIMGENDLKFYLSDTVGGTKGPDGMIASTDVVLIKINCQWSQRGGTNTDLLMSLIEAIVDHPDGFNGEIVVADNGQAQYGSAGEGGSMNWDQNNGEDKGKSVQDVVDSFSSTPVSAYLWDTITTNEVEEYSTGDMEDGYILLDDVDLDTGLQVSYPKFRTSHGTYISFKQGIWNPERGEYDGDKLKVINVPVLKSHSIYGVTACVKHYMGVPSDKLTARLGHRTHNTIGDGGMGTLMVETRYPTLNILDAIWVNANPLGASRGPSTSYDSATRLNIILASTDPVALDFWASKHLLCEAAPEGSDTATMNPESQSNSFGKYLRLSMEQLVDAGYQVTMNEDQMNIHIMGKG